LHEAQLLPEHAALLVDLVDGDLGAHLDGHAAEGGGAGDGRRIADAGLLLGKGGG